jgi:hypothetical protein
VPAQLLSATAFRDGGIERSSWRGREKRERERERERETTQSREGCVGVRACEVRDQRDRLADKRERESARIRLSSLTSAAAGSVKLAFLWLCSLLRLQTEKEERIERSIATRLDLVSHHVGNSAAAKSRSWSSNFFIRPIGLKR